MSDSIINIEHLNKTFEVDKTKMEILRDINLKISPGEFVTIVGHSGCGKSTLLKIICGLVSYEDGKVERSGKPVSGPGPSCGMVFQEHRLLPWLKIKDNISFGLKLSKEEKDKRVGHYLEMVGLKDFANSYPAQLSGGMSQRAAIARGLANKMQKEILAIQEKEGTTMVLVTHDIDEAIYLGDRIVVMSARPGEIKDIIKTDRYASRRRNSPEFANYRKKIYDYFFEDVQDYEIEYNI